MAYVNARETLGIFAPVWGKLVNLALQHEIVVFLVDGLERQAGFKGLWVETQFRKLIFIDRGLLQDDQNFILAHEMGHAFLHAGNKQTCLYNAPPEIENEANKFATRLLEQIERSIYIE
jgi:Zn-dependent peptidase ImmA (M78 family)